MPVPPEFRYRGRQTFYKGVKMRSRLEATAAALFDRYAVEWQYEPMCFASEMGQYLPDFLVMGMVEGCGDDRCHVEMGLTYVEVKPAELTTKEVMRRMEIVWESDPSAHLLVLDPIEMEANCAPHADYYKTSLWNWGQVRPECHWIWTEDDPEGANGGLPGPKCGLLHVDVDPTYMHPGHDK